MHRSNLRTRFVAPAAGAILALIAIATFGGCFVSFDGYQLGDTNGGAAGSGDVAGNGGAADAGRSGDTSGGAGHVGSGNHAGSAGANAGSANGGNAASGSAGSSNAGGASAGAGVGGASGASGSAGSSGGSAGSAGGPALVCPEPHNRIAVEIPKPSGGIYCIDRAEVKNIEYRAFLDAQTDTSGQSAVCAWNSSFEPATGNGCTQFDPVNLPNQPIACVDWCDAAAYCKWEGKHLCGKIAGGANATTAFADADQDAWFRACSHAGDFDFPYGNVYQGMKCVGTENSAIRPVAVPNTNCEGGYSGLYDMSGNVAEWEDSCSASAGAGDACVHRGGSYLDTNKQVGGAPSLLCNSNVHNAPIVATKPRNTRDKEIGFRCCSDPVPAP